MNLKLQFCHLDVEDLKVLEESEKMSKASDLLSAGGCSHLFKLFLSNFREQNSTKLDENTEAERAAKIKEVQKEIQVQNITNVTTSYEISEIVFFTTEPRSFSWKQSKFSWCPIWDKELMPLKFQAMSEFQDAKAEAAELEKKAKRWAETGKLRVSCKAKKLMAYQKDNTIIQIVCMLI